jgi:hypothetical protein
MRWSITALHSRCTQRCRTQTFPTLRLSIASACQLTPNLPPPPQRLLLLPLPLPLLPLPPAPPDLSVCVFTFGSRRRLVRQSRVLQPCNCFGRQRKEALCCLLLRVHVRRRRCSCRNGGDVRKTGQQRTWRTFASASFSPDPLVRLSLFSIAKVLRVVFVFACLSLR